MDAAGSFADMQFFWSKDPTGKNQLSIWDMFETRISPPKVLMEPLQIQLRHDQITSLQTFYHSLGLGQNPNAIIELLNLPPIELYFNQERVAMISIVISQRAILIPVNNGWFLALYIQITARRSMQIG
ncbi:hypothetical protein BDQ12DRAFT_668927 [Crucibulum laeve]|uniref:Uncharacterized protein n=1 Tax=Crucibulum laeve TaxID=68775 RepID=A0A5C3LQS9_9AGAR|nr:hypothetical protein BDQ12DRAFT_668927 [Crucibulum laeve]